MSRHAGHRDWCRGHTGSRPNALAAKEGKEEKMGTLVKTKKAKWFDRLSSEAENALTWIILGGFLLFVIVLFSLLAGLPKPEQPVNFIADWDGVSQITVSYDPIPKEYIVSYRTCTGANTFLRLKADQVKPKETFRGNPCPINAQATQVK